MIIGRIVDGPNCGRWPRWARRAYLLTLPVSFPAYMVLCVVWFLYVIAWAVLHDLACVKWVRRTWA